MFPQILALRRNRIFIVVVILAASAAGVSLWQRQAAAARAAQAALRQETVQRGTIVATVSATGNLSAQSQVNLFFSASPPVPVVVVNVSLGQTVRRGEVLARLDDRDLALAVRQAEQNLQSAKLQLAQLQAAPRPEDLAVLQAGLRLAGAQASSASQGPDADAVQVAWLNLVLARNQLDQTYARMQWLEEHGRFGEKSALQSLADQQVQAAKIADLQYQAIQNPPASGPAASAQAAVAQAQAALDKLQHPASAEDVQIAELQVDQAQAALELARHNLSGAQIAAPFDGVVAAVNLNFGEPAAGAIPAIVLADVSQFYLDVSVDEVDVSRVAAGQAVTVTVDALPNALLGGVVERIAPAATSTAGGVSYRVRLALEASVEPLRGGMTATADIVVAQAQDVLIIPNWAIRRDRASGQTFAGVLRQGQITDVPVELGLRNETYSEVTGGLSAGDVVAVDTAHEQLRFFGGE